MMMGRKAGGQPAELPLNAAGTAVLTEGTGGTLPTGGATAANQALEIAALALLSQPTVAATVTTHDTNAQVATKGLWVGTGGNITGRLSGDGADRVWKNIPSGTYVPGNFVLIKVATTAADILAYS